MIKVLLDNDISGFQTLLIGAIKSTGCEACVESLLTIVLELNNHLGTGRLYIP